MFNYCINRGELDKNMHHLKLGPQHCKWCGAKIIVTKTSKTFAYVPKHKRITIDVQDRTTLQSTDENNY